MPNRMPPVAQPTIMSSVAMPPQYFTSPSEAVAPSNSRSAGSRERTKILCPVQSNSHPQEAKKTTSQW